MNQSEDKQRESVFSAVGRWIASNSFGLAMAFLVFMSLPLLQIVANLGKKDMEVREVAVVQPPPPPAEMEEPEPEEPPEPEPQPQMEDMQPLSLSDLALSLNPSGGGGSGAKILSDALAGSMEKAESAFAMGDLDQKPRAIEQSPPTYPATLRKQNVMGVVNIDAVIDARGRVVNPRVVSSPHPLFADAAIDAVKKWRFEPGVRGGEKVPFKIRIPIRFGAAA